MNNLSIGIFDSGVGGLTVAQAIYRLLPNENLLYFGDSAHVPYGNKSKESIIEYSLNNRQFLEKQGIKMLVVACNTSTAIAVKELKKNSPFPVIGVIYPVCEEAALNSNKIGIIGTYRTITSKAYSRTIKSINVESVVLEKACPLFVPLIEENFSNENILKLIIKEYLDGIISKIDTLVLGCTHYPFIKKKIKNLYPKLNIIDSTLATAKYVLKTMEEKSLKSNQKKGKIKIFTNDKNEIFNNIALKIFPKITIESIKK